MPVTTKIEDADALTAVQAMRLLAAIRASAAYRDESSLYQDVDSVIKARILRRVSIISVTNASPIVVTVASHPFEEGDLVTVDGVIGTTAANESWALENVTPTTFELSGSAGNAVYASGGRVTDLISQHLSAISDALDLVTDGTVRIEGGKDALFYSQVSDREALIKEALNAVYNVEITGDQIIVGQRGCKICRCGWMIGSSGRCANSLCGYCC